MDVNELLENPPALIMALFVLALLFAIVITQKDQIFKAMSFMTGIVK